MSDSAFLRIFQYHGYNLRRSVFAPSYAEKN